MRSNIRWLGFWEDFPWKVAVLIAWLLVTSTSLAIALTAPDMPRWLQIGVVVLVQVLFGTLVSWSKRRARRRRTEALKAVAQRMGMTFSSTLGEDRWLPPQSLLHMAKRRGRPRNLLAGERAGVKVSLFDLFAGGSNSTREQTVVYFPDPMPGLGDFPGDWLGLTTSAAHNAVATEFSGLAVEAKEGRLIVYRWQHRVRPESYPEFLALALQIHQRLAQFAKAVTENGKSVQSFHAPG
jgi:hypothetical protein